MIEYQCTYVGDMLKPAYNHVSSRQVRCVIVQ